MGYLILSPRQRLSLCVSFKGASTQARGFFEALDGETCPIGAGAVYSEQQLANNRCFGCRGYSEWPFTTASGMVPDSSRSLSCEERAYNPRLQVDSVAEYVEIMNTLDLPNPKMMDVAVPANLQVGLSQDEIEARGWSLDCAAAQALLGRPEQILVDLRDTAERARHGVIPGSVHAPYPELAVNVRPGGLLHELAKSTGHRLVFYCAYGERSAMAVQAAQEAGLAKACHIKGGIDAWKKAGGPLDAEAETARGPGSEDT